MGTRFSVQVVAPPALLDRAALQRDIDDELRKINDRLSTYSESSEISRFNASREPGWTEVSARTCRLVEQALDIGRRTNGAFDITVGPLVDAWGFGPGPRRDRPLPDEQIASLMPSVGFAGLDADCSRPALRKADPAMAIDLSGMAKGYAVDRLADLVERRGIGDYLVEIGGEIRARGANGRGRAWRIAIEHPLVPGGEPPVAILLRDAALATSGDYRNYFEAGGKRYSHTLDPRTGYPVTHALTSVTVLADTAAEADALATALLVLGPEAGLKMAEEQSIAASFLSRDGEALERSWSTAFVARSGGRSAGLSRRSPDPEGSS